VKVRVLETELLYDGSQLSPEFAFSHGLQDDSIVAFVGSAKVDDHLVDLEDRQRNDFIVSEKMLHFVVTILGNSITEAVLWQRLFVNTIANHLRVFIPGSVRVEGDDILVDGAKLSVSIATVSPTKELIHIGLNWRAGKTPVKTFSLEAVFSNKFDEKWVLKKVSGIIRDEFEDVRRACFKVKTF